MKTYTFRPDDLLFFRDGRPIDTVGGYGARWPDAPMIFDALHAALHRAFPDKQDWEHTHCTGRSSQRDFSDTNRKQRFGGLATVGIFPVLGAEWLFPAPADWRVSGDERGASQRPAEPPPGAHLDLPAPLRYPLLNQVEPSKTEAASWWSRAAWEEYLAGKETVAAGMHRNAELFSSEWFTGIGMNAETQTQDGERIYSAEYLRLRDEVRCGFFGALPTKQQNATVAECLGHLLDGAAKIIIGGQQRTCSVVSEETKIGELLPQGAVITGTRVKWVLLTPALFPAIPENQKKNVPAHPGGWLPTWISPTDGAVRLLDGPGRNKAQRTQSTAGQPIQANLVAACIPKPIALSGWSERLDAAKGVGEKDNIGPRATQLAVPAGAVYYFEAANAAQAGKLAEALNWHGAAGGTEIKNRRSTLLGEKGLGLGVCGPWEFAEGFAPKDAPAA